MRALYLPPGNLLWSRDADLLRDFPASKLYLTCMAALPLLPDYIDVFGYD
jgi:hypothetical protein